MMRENATYDCEVRCESTYLIQLINVFANLFHYNCKRLTTYLRQCLHYRFNHSDFFLKPLLVECHFRWVFVVHEEIFQRHKNRICHCRTKNKCPACCSTFAVISPPISEDEDPVQRNWEEEAQTSPEL